MTMSRIQWFYVGKKGLKVEVNSLQTILLEFDKYIYNHRKTKHPGFGCGVDIKKYVEQKSKI